ncbi:MAG: hypothetical protein AAFO29_17485 [Actinomycetota bacterium]
MSSHTRPLLAVVTMALVLVMTAGCGLSERRSAGSNDTTSSTASTADPATTVQPETVADDGDTASEPAPDPDPATTSESVTVADEEPAIEPVRAMDEDEVAELEAKLDELDRLLGDIESDFASD